jgi:hypothetical protein
LDKSNMGEARRLAERAGLLPPSAEGAYNLACFWARAGDKTRAMRYFERAYDLGFRSRYSSSDSDLGSIRGAPGFDALAREMKSFEH